MCLSCLIIRLQNKQTFHILALHDLRQVFVSCDLDVLRNKGSWAFLSDYPQINKVEKPDHMVSTTSKATRGVHKVESKKGKEISTLQTMAFLFTSDYEVISSWKPNGKKLNVVN